MSEITKALKPYGYDYLVSMTGIMGSGSLIVVFAGPGDFYTACLTHDNKVVWVMSCGGQDVDSSIDEINSLHAKVRSFYATPGLNSGTASVAHGTETVEPEAVKP